MLPAPEKSAKSMDGSEPSGAGPITGPLGSCFFGVGRLNGMLTVRWSSSSAPLILPSKTLMPDLKAIWSPSTTPSRIGEGASSPPNQPPGPSTVPVSLPPSCVRVKMRGEPSAEAASPVPGADAATHRPVTPAPLGIGRSQIPTCGRSSIDLLETLAEAAVSPGDVPPR